MFAKVENKDGITLKDIREFIKNDIILVLNKRDLLPLSVREDAERYRDR